jgi:hypothetical protein
MNATNESNQPAPRAIPPPPTRAASASLTTRCPFVLLGIVVGAYALVTFVPMLAGAAIPPGSVRSHAFFPTLLPIHAVSGAVALLIASVRISPCRRELSSRGQRRLDYTYMGAVAISGPTGLLVATAADGGWTARVGFLALGALWLKFTAAGLCAAIGREPGAQERAMMRSVALAFAVVSPGRAGCRTSSGPSGKSAAHETRRPHRFSLPCGLPRTLPPAG